MIVSLDTETTGVDLFHGASPYLVTFGFEDGTNRFFEWDVDPLTRRVMAPDDDLEEIQRIVDEAETIVGQNVKFDRRALEVASPGFRWDWGKVRDTLIAGHLLASNHAHDLTSMCVEYLGIGIQKWEDRMETAVKDALRIVKREFHDWRLAKKGLPEMPSAKGESKERREKGEEKHTLWKFDAWLPRALLKEIVTSLRFSILPDAPDLPTVVRSTESHDVDISRGTRWGNPFVIGRDGDRETVVRRYAERVWDDSELLAALWKLHGKRLGCRGNCAPNLCHGHVLRALCHPWRTVTADYANVDSTSTLMLWQAQERLVKDRGLWNIYLRRMRLPAVASRLEANGATGSVESLERMESEFATNMVEHEKTCVAIAGEDRLPELPKGVSNELRGVMFGRIEHRCSKCKKKHTSAVATCEKCGKPVTTTKHDSVLDLPVTHWTEKAGEPAVNKDSIADWLATLDPDSDQWRFVNGLFGHRQGSTALGYLGNYRRYGVNGEVPGVLRLHSSLNPTAADTLRWGSSNPPLQNISKKEDYNLRRFFGPAPGREWWSADAQNIELRIPAYESGEKDLIHVFEHPDDPPYYGSYHLVVFDLLHPEMFAEHGKKCKQLFEATWYQWTKNGNFALIYGAQESTADKTYRVPGAFKMIRQRFPKIAELSDRMMAMAQRTGFVETIPDRSVDPERGYPLLCTRSERGGIVPTVPLNYHVQSTAMQWMGEAMIRCQEQLDDWNLQRRVAALESLERMVQATREEFERQGFLMVLQVHDELVFDFPRGRGSESWRANLPKMRRLQRLMESCGDGISVPTPVALEYHSSTWAEGKSI